MAQICVSNLTFCYEGSFDNIFEDVSFVIDTDWKLGFIGRNGKGKTTFLNILSGKYAYQGNISTSTVFDYFPYQITQQQKEQCASEFLAELKPGCEEWRVIYELDKLQTSAEILYRPFGTLSFGEQTKVMLAVLFAGDNDFLLIDEPTNHLDHEARQIIKKYLADKKGFILVSHDRDLLDACIDHVLVLNRKSIEIQSGNFSSWWENKMRKDTFLQMENEKHLRQIGQLKRAAEQSARWAQQNENTKIGYDPKKEPDRDISTRAYIGAKTKKMQSRVKSYEKRMQREIEEKEGLLVDIENPVDLKLYPDKYHKDVLVSAKDYTFTYTDAKEAVIDHLSFELRQGERIFLKGSNGCGKSTLIKNILSHVKGESPSNGKEEGLLKTGSGLTVSYINQDTGFLKGSIREFCKERELDESLFCALLRQLDMDRVQFEKNMEGFSEGQKEREVFHNKIEQMSMGQRKKVELAKSLSQPAELYIWDEPLNYIDVFTRMQIEELLLKYQPTMLLVDHDESFCNRIATRIIEFSLDERSFLHYNLNDIF